MSDAQSASPVRERNRNGIKTLDWSQPPTAEEGFIDKLTIKIAGSLQAPTYLAVRDFASRLNNPPQKNRAEGRVSRIFGGGSWRGSRFDLPVVRGTSIAGGRLSLLQRGDGARIDVELHLNPTRTINHLFAKHTFDQLTELSPLAFFQLVDAQRISAPTLDRRDNMIASFDRVGGSVYAARVERLGQFLKLFEQKLRALLVEVLCPPDLGWQHSSGADIIADNDGCHVRLNFGALSVTHCEVYWERKTPDALEAAKQVADHVLSSARAAEARTYNLPSEGSVERLDASITVEVPLSPSRTMALVIYAKAADRLRFEVRYKSDLPQSVRGAISEGHDRLWGWFSALRRDATPRLPWDKLKPILRPSGRASVGIVLDLVDAVDLACSGDLSQRRTILEQLLTTGGLSTTGDAGVVPERIARKLVSAGIVRRVKLLKREDRDAGLRFVLSGSFAGLNEPWGSTDV